MVLIRSGEFEIVREHLNDSEGKILEFVDSRYYNHLVDKKKWPKRGQKTVFSLANSLIKRQTGHV